jgi:hypothetical protein
MSTKTETAVQFTCDLCGYEEAIYNFPAGLTQCLGCGIVTPNLDNIALRALGAINYQREMYRQYLGEDTK